MDGTPAAANSDPGNAGHGPTDAAAAADAAIRCAGGPVPTVLPSSRRSAELPPGAAGQRGAGGIGLSSLMAAMGIDLPDAPPRPGGTRPHGLDHLAQFDWLADRDRTEADDHHSSDGLLFDVHFHAFGCGDTLSDHAGRDQRLDVSQVRSHRSVRTVSGRVGPAGGGVTLAARDPERSAEFVVSFATGRASALFFDAMISGEGLGRVVFAASTSEGQQYLRLELSDVLVCAYDQLSTTAAHHVRLDTFALDYAALRYTYFPRYGDHAFGPPSSGSWVNPRRLD